MKKSLMFGLMLLSCSSYGAGNTSDLAKIFELIKAKKISEAESKIKAGPSYYDGGYEKGLPLEADSSKDSLNGFLQSAIKFFETCDSAVEELKKTKPIPKRAKSKVDDEEETESEDQTAGNTELLPKSLEECKRLGQRIENSMMNYSDVNFDPAIEVYRLKFEKETHRIKNIPDKAEVEKKRLADKSKSEKQKREYEQSPAFYSKKLCEFQQQVDAGHSVIDNENNSAKYSGVVDKTRLYNAGQIITTYEGLIKKYSAEMKSKFSKSWSKSDCK